MAIRNILSNISSAIGLFSQTSSGPWQHMALSWGFLIRLTPSIYFITLHQIITLNGRSGKSSQLIPLPHIFFIKKLFKKPLKKFSGNENHLLFFCRHLAEDYTSSALHCLTKATARQTPTGVSLLL